jgi:hypothetical protein
MMNDSRLKLHMDLLEILGSNNVYFQPPESINMKYPAIVYSRSDIDNVHAGDNIYGQRIKYKVTIIDYDPDSLIVERMSKFKFAIFDRHYAVNGLNHDQFTVSYKK